MNSVQFADALSSTLPSERMRAAQWALENTLSPGHQRLLIDAAAREGVPRIRAAFSAALKQQDRQSPADDVTGVPEEQILETLDQLGGLIRHEMQPAIGWVRFAANRELEEFEASATNRAIEALRRRVDGLAGLAAAHRMPVREIVSLSEIVSDCISIEYPSSMFTLDQNEQLADDVLTDPGLLSLILTNAVQNAADAARALPSGEGEVFISTNLNSEWFWLTITNRFAGASFEFSNVAASGRTSKRGHRGLGTKIFELASGRLGYEFDLSAAGGTATFSLRGSRFD